MGRACIQNMCLAGPALHSPKHKIMKKSIIIIIIGLQTLTIAGIGITAYFTFMNKARIQATQRVMIDTKTSLEPTIAFMNQVQESKQQMEEAQMPLQTGGGCP